MSSLTPKRIIIAPNAFKGSLTAVEAARAMRRGVLRSLPDAEVVLMPIADGGDGLIEALLAQRGGRLASIWVTGPFAERRRACFGFVAGRGSSAIIEMAKASGLALNGGKRDALGATSYGTGELIREAARKGAKTIFVGMGGSASNDGGAGMAQALGVRLLDKKGRELALGARALRGLAQIDASAAKKTMRGARIIGLTDVDNPLVGPRGSARVFGPQKGATPMMVGTIEKALRHYAAVIKRDLNIDVAKVPGAGAAGGLGAGLLAFLGAELRPGAKAVLEELGVGGALRGASAALTSEGWLDRTSLYGKAPIVFSGVAETFGVPTALVCAGADSSVLRAIKRRGVSAVVTFAEAGATPSNSMAHAARWAARSAAIAVGKLGLACVLALCAISAAAAGDFKEIDRLYSYRHEGKNLDESIEKLEALTAANPKDPDALWRLGRSLLRRGERQTAKKEKLKYYLEAEGKIRDAIALKDDDPQSHFFLGLAMGRRGETQGIMNSLFIVGPLKKEMATVIRLDPGHGGAHHVLGELYRQLPRLVGGNKKEAVRQLEEAVKLDPNRTVHYPALAEAYLAVGEKDRAIETLKKTFEVKDPMDPAEYADDLKDAKEMLVKVGK